MVLEVVLVVVLEVVLVVMVVVEGKFLFAPGSRFRLGGCTTV